MLPGCVAFTKRGFVGIGVGVTFFIYKSCQADVRAKHPPLMLKRFPQVHDANFKRGLFYTFQVHEQMKRILLYLTMI
jgi:hypothetical protein